MNALTRLINKYNRSTDEAEKQELVEKINAIYLRARDFINN